jgi:uncharacterized protein YbaR (Trm112 family)
MKKKCADIYVCPLTKESLILDSNEIKDDTILTGKFNVDNPQINYEYQLRNGTPSFIKQEDVDTSSAENKENNYYQEISQEYDEVMDWVFKSFYLDELEVRTNLIDLLDIKPSDLVLETGCGTCRDSELIMGELDNTGGLRA